MTEAQLAAIDGMGLTMEDTRSWMEEQGIEMAVPAGDQGVQSGQAPGMLQGMSEDERAKMREEFLSMSAEERATRVAEMGVQPPEGGPPEGGEMEARFGGQGAPGAAGGRANVLVGPLVELLTERAAG
jgi:hypothetical protein